MNDAQQSFHSLDTAREAMRVRLNREFRSLHRRRRQRRIAAACLAPAALVAAIVLWNWYGPNQQENSLPQREQLAATQAPLPSAEKSQPENALKLVEGNASDLLPKNAGFQHIDFIELKPGDLPKWLAEAKSDLIVYEVGGRREVVSERELLANSSKKRKQRVN